MARDPHVDGPHGVFDASAALYVEFAGTELGPATEDETDLQVLAEFVELTRATGRLGTVADLGCGPGRAAAYISRHGLDVAGLDVSWELLVLGRDAHPAIPFLQGRLDRLPLADSCLLGAVCWYSIIFTPPGLLPAIVAELARVIVPGGLLLLAFQSGSADVVVTTNAQATGITLTTYRHDPDQVAARVREGPFGIHTTALRAPSLPHESTDQAFLIARRQ